MVYTTIALLAWLWRVEGLPPWWIVLAMLLDSVALYPEFRTSVSMILAGV